MDRGTPPIRLFAGRRAGFTLVELLVVIAVITVLLAAVIVASSTLINSAKARNTSALLATVRQAVEQFRSDQTRKPTLTSVRQQTVTYASRYGQDPPDEVEPFTLKGLPTTSGNAGTLGAGKARLVPGPDNGQPPPGRMRFYRGLPAEQAANEHRDQTAMIAAIRMFSEAGSVMLDSVPARNWSPGVLNPTGGLPMLFLDRGPGLNGTWNASEDLAIRHIVDDWGTELGYMSQRDWRPTGAGSLDTTSTNSPEWNQASTQMLKLNGDQPVIFSYGPNGREQLTREAMGDTGAASLAADWVSNSGRLLNAMNADNVYAHDGLAAKLNKGVND